jgi:cell division control protein 6
MEENKDQSGIDIIKKAMERPSIFKDEKPLSLEFIPSKLHHRESEFLTLAQIFKSVMEKPSTTSQRVLISGDIGTGKTVLSQRFGMDIENKAKSEGAKIKYLHINCREHRGSFFMILNRVITEFISGFPQRGFSTEELIQTLLSLLDDKDTHLILALDEFDTLLNSREDDEVNTLYSLTRIQEGRLNAPVRLSLICIVRDLSLLNRLDKSTLSVLQQNVIKLDNYSSDQLKTILKDRADLAFKEGAISLETTDLIADLASIPGDARYAIELVWKAGKCADLEGDKMVVPKHVRKAAETMYSPIRQEYLDPLVIHEKLILIALSRLLERDESAYATMGEVEKMYELVCEEYKEKPRAHTQFWTYIKNLDSCGILSTQISGKGLRGKTTLIGLTSPSPSIVEKQLQNSLQERLKKN